MAGDRIVDVGLETMRIIQRWDEIKLADGHKFTVPDFLTDADINADKGKRTE